MVKEEIIVGLYKKLSYDTLESLETIMGVCNIDKYLYMLLSLELKRRYEEEKEELEGRREYDFITRVLNCDLSEIENNLDNYTEEELLILKYIFDNSSRYFLGNKLERKLEYKVNNVRDIIVNKIPNAMLTEDVRVLFEKLTMLELDALYFICKNSNLNLDEENMEILDEIYKNNRNINKLEIEQITAGIHELLDDTDKFTNAEKNFIKEKAESAVINLCNQSNPTDLTDSFMIDLINDVKDTYDTELQSLIKKH